MLGEHALRLTPADDAERGERLLALGGLPGASRRAAAGHRPAGAGARRRCPPGRPRARAWLLLSEGGAVESHAERARTTDARWPRARDDPELRRAGAGDAGAQHVAVGVERIAEAEACRRQRGGTATSSRSRCARWPGRDACADSPIDDVCERFAAPPRHGAVHRRLARAGGSGCGSCGAASSTGRARRRPGSSRSPTSAARRCPTRGCG